MFLLSDVQKVPLSISAVDAAGNPAPVENVTWASSNEAVLTVVASADGLSAEAVAVGPLGTAQVQVTADAKIGADVKEISGVLDVEVVASEAVSLQVATGEPVDK